MVHDTVKGFRPSHPLIVGPGPDHVTIYSRQPTCNSLVNALQLGLEQGIKTMPGQVESEKTNAEKLGLSFGMPYLTCVHVVENWQMSKVSR